jgi:hypothetical protein
MSILGKFFMFLFVGAFALALIACPPAQQEPAGEEEVVVEEVEQAPAEVVEEVEEVVEEAPADDSGDMADDSGDDSGDDAGDGSDTQ